MLKLLLGRDWLANRDEILKRIRKSDDVKKNVSDRMKNDQHFGE